MPLTVPYDWHNNSCNGPMTYLGHCRRYSDPLRSFHKVLSFFVYSVSLLSTLLLISAKLAITLPLCARFVPNTAPNYAEIVAFCHSPRVESAIPITRLAQAIIKLIHNTLKHCPGLNAIIFQWTLGSVTLPKQQRFNQWTPGCIGQKLGTTI